MHILFGACLGWLALKGETSEGMVLVLFLKVSLKMLIETTGVYFAFNENGG